MENNVTVKKIKTIFLVTPIGEKASKERIHADAMYNNVFKPIEDEYGYSFVRADNKPSIGFISEKIYKSIDTSDIVIVDTVWNNLNVLYEVGLAHAMNKPVIFINPEGNHLPSDLNPYEYIPYDRDTINSSRNANIINDLQNKLIEIFKKLENDDKAGLYSYHPYFAHFKENIHQKILENIFESIKDLKETMIMSRDKVRVIADYIEGEDAAFSALTRAIKEARESVRTTRFSPYSVIKRQNLYFNTLNGIMDVDTNPHCPNRIHRIITTNHEEKLREIKSLVTNNLGRKFSIYLSKEAYNFEIVIIDKETVFIHFKKKEQKRDEKGNILSATLKFTCSIIARQFVEIFRSMTENSFYTILCETITKENLDKELETIEEEFNEGLKDYNDETKDEEKTSK